jgi:8-oxo-dGTP pyrophosphatase MutT (NUDIX family)
MGAGILPVAVYKGQLYFLFGKENRHSDTPGWADFGGGKEKGETQLQTAVRECSEELTGFLGSQQEIRNRIREKGVFIIDSHDDTYRIHVLPIDYDDALPHYYNANQRFLQKYLDPEIYKRSKIFEKSEIRWFSLVELKSRRSHFRNYYRRLVDEIYGRRDEIRAFL